MVAPLLVGIVSLVATAVLVQATASLVAAQERAWFQNMVGAGVNAIEEGIQSDVNSATVAAHLFASTGELNKGGFDRFVRHLGRYNRPGLEQVGWCLRVTSNGKMPLIARARSAGIEDFSIVPEGERSEYCPVVFLTNERAGAAIGQDLLTNSEFARASQVARRGGTISAARSQKPGSVTLVIPVYRAGKTLETSKARSAAIRGFAFVSYSIAGTAERVSRSVRDQTEVRLYQPIGNDVLGVVEARSAGILETPTFVERRIVNFGDVPIVAEFISSDTIRRDSERPVVDIALVAGLMVSLLLVAVTGAEARARVRAVRAGDRLAESEEELKKVNAAKDEFLAVVSHELRNPIGAIGSALQVLRLKRRPEELLPAERRALDVAERQVRHQSRLIEDLLDASRLSAGKVALKLQYLDLNEVVRRSVTSVKAAVAEREQRLSVKTAAKIVPVHGDAVRLEQVFANLLTNASKYTPSDREVSISVVPKGSEEVEVVVADQGIGLEQRFVKEIFEPFFQRREGTHPSEGLGLGLSVVRGLVDLHRGRVEASSEGLGRGSTFTVRLPIADHPIDATLDVQAPTRPSTVGRTQRALVIDDMDDGREMLREFLELLGYQVEVAGSGRAAIESLSTVVPDVALVDIGLPDIDGVKLARRIRETTGCEQTRLIAVTGYGSPHARERAMKGDFEAYLVKPVDLQKLLALLREGPLDSSESSTG